ncbi:MULTISPECIES: toxin-antitoxin system YwqK family antitoxin [unclassified Acinetobacter]|uniref:toxin-antitoxin system YwqK family antitoxin n=1 Tax=unclassified Acinetobacter TaxID=196816 RepID=UPI0035BA32C5
MRNLFLSHNRHHLAKIILALGLSVTAFSTTQVFANTTATASTTDLSQYKTSTTQPILYYFDADGEVSNKLSEDGYYRVLLGRNFAGHYLVQDMYANHTKQTDPMWFSSFEGLSNFNNLGSHGAVVVYYKDGTVSRRATYENSELIGQSFTYYPSGKLAIIQKAKHYDYFYENGKRAVSYDLDSDDEQINVKGWHEDGTTIDDEDESKGVASEINGILY